MTGVPTAADAELESDEDHAYFKEIEAIFLELRGSPLTLSSTDWHVARRWFRAGVPLSLVRQVMDEVFAKRAERKTRGKISSLRYVAKAVEGAWAERREMTAPGEREAAPEVDLATRLAALAAALPEALPGRAELAGRIMVLNGASETVEAGLAALDAEMLRAAEAGLGEEARAAVALAVEQTVAGLAGRLDPAEIAEASVRLSRQVLRQRLALPVLSLFSPEAQPGAG